MPPLADGTFEGGMRYAPFNTLYVTTGSTACPGSENDFGVPVPVGYVADYFDHIQIGNGQSITFEPGTFEGTLSYATTLSPKTNYYMYVYDLNHNLVESYQMGPFKKGRRETIKFTSPLENGFVLATFIDLEIAHPTPS